MRGFVSCIFAWLTLFAFMPSASSATSDVASTVVLLGAPNPVYAAATRLFHERRYAAAYGRFVRLADAGDANAARIALMMYLNGTKLFNSDWDATPDQLHRWSELANPPWPSCLLQPIEGKRT